MAFAFCHLPAFRAVAMQRMRNYNGSGLTLPDGLNELAIVSAEEPIANPRLLRVKPIL